MRSRSRRVLGVTVLAAVLALPVWGVLATLRTSGRIIVTGTDVVSEDLYAVGNRTIVEGVVEGDLVVLTGELIVTGRVDGNVLGVVGGSARIDGTVGGSVRLAALSLDVTGSVGGDVAGLVGDAGVAADVRRDVLLVAGEAIVGGEVGRDVRAQAWSLEVHGAVARDVLARSDDLRVGGGAAIGGDLLFKASDVVEVADGAVAGAVSQRRVLAPVWAKAAARAFAWLSLFGFIFGSIVLFWLFRTTSQRSVEAVAEVPGRAAAVGLAVVLAPPALMVPLGLSLVGLPVAVLLLLVWAVILVLGPAPAVAWAGRAMMRDRSRVVGPLAMVAVAAQGAVWVVSLGSDGRWGAAAATAAGVALFAAVVWQLLRGRSGIYGAVVVGALAWRAAIWVFSLVAAVIYIVALVVGVGAFVVAAWERRRDGSGDWRPLAPEAT
jgi:hypothetical protein